MDWRRPFLEAGIVDGLLHSDVRVGCGIAHEAQHLAVDVLLDVDVDAAGHLAPKPHFPEALVGNDTRAPGPQCIGDFV